MAAQCFARQQERGCPYSFGELVWCRKLTEWHAAPVVSCLCDVRRLSGEQDTGLVGNPSSPFTQPARPTSPACGWCTMRRLGPHVCVGVILAATTLVFSAPPEMDWFLYESWLLLFYLCWDTFSARTIPISTTVSCCPQNNVSPFEVY